MHLITLSLLTTFSILFLAHFSTGSTSSPYGQLSKTLEMDFVSLPPSSSTSLGEAHLMSSHLDNSIILNNNSINNNSSISFGELMIEACSSQAMTAFDQRSAPPRLIACCLALSIADCMVEQCGSLGGSGSTGGGSYGSTGDNGSTEIAECSPLGLVALRASMNASCEMVNVVNVSLRQCEGLAMTGNLGLVAALMISTFLLVTLLCGLHAWATSKLRKLRSGGKAERRGGGNGGGGEANKTPRGTNMQNAAGGAADKKKDNSSNSAFLGTRRRRRRSSRMASKMGMGVKVKQSSSSSSLIKSKGLKRGSTLAFGGKLPPLVLELQQKKAQSSSQSKKMKSLIKLPAKSSRAPGQKLLPLSSKASAKKMKLQ